MPTTSSDSPAKLAMNLHPAFFVGNWMLFSCVVILFNKWLIDESRFPYPVMLTTWHLGFSTLVTQILARTTTLLDGRKEVRMTGRVYLRAIVPIGVFYSLSLVCSNLTYLYLSVAFIQMLKAGAPAAVLFTSWIFGVAKPDLLILLNILIIVFGVALASFGEIEFSLAGFLYQMGGLVFEAIRLIMIQILLSDKDKEAEKEPEHEEGFERVETEEVDDDIERAEKIGGVEGDEEANAKSISASKPKSSGYKMDPLVSLYYYAPVCAVMNLLVATIAEIPTFEVKSVWATGPWILFANAAVAFMLNVASVFLIGKTSSLVLTLAGVLKNILIIFTSVLVWGTVIAPSQYLGYTIALAALTYYSLGWDGCKQLLPTWLLPIVESFAVNAAKDLANFRQWVAEKTMGRGRVIAMAATIVLGVGSLLFVIRHSGGDWAAEIPWNS